MRLSTGLIALRSYTSASLKMPKPQPEPKSVTVPITLDHNRVVLDVDLPLPDGSTSASAAGSITAIPICTFPASVATLMGLAITCDDKSCSAPPPREITIRRMKIPLAAVEGRKIPLKPVAAAAVMAPGMTAEINIPSSVLRNYDVLINFPDREFTIGSARQPQFQWREGKGDRECREWPHPDSQPD